MRNDKNSFNKYSMVIKQLLSLHFSGCYITNKEFVDIGKKVGIDVDLADREAVLKNIVSKAVEMKKEAELFKEISNLLKSRFDEYKRLLDEFEHSSEIIKEWMQKLRSTDMLLSQRAKMSIYE